MSVHLSNGDKLNLISNLATMLAAGIPLMESIETLLEEVKGNQKKILLILRDDVNQGKKISDSFAKFPDSFDPVTIHLIAAAEESGTLDTTLHDLIITIKKDMEFVDKVRSAMIYPMFVFCVFIGVMLVILTFVIPRVSETFSHLNVVLPLPTRVLIIVSAFLLKNTWQIGVALILLAIVIGIFYRKNKKALFNLVFSLPILSGLSREIDLTRFTRSFALLLMSGIPIVNALELAQQVMIKKELIQMVDDAREMVSAGQKISEAFKKHKKYIPGLMIRITQAGEKSGALSEAMQNLSEYFDDRVSKSVKNFTTLLEPIMLLMIGVGVGGMMLAVIAPIYGLISSINAH